MKKTCAVTAAAHTKGEQPDIIHNAAQKVHIAIAIAIAWAIVACGVTVGHTVGGKGAAAQKRR
jgi:hypothetical protein